MERRRKNWKAGEAYHHSSNSTSMRQKFNPNVIRSPVNYDPMSSTAEHRTEESQDSSKRPTIIGTCPDMCPARERTQREQLRDLSVFERLNGNPGRTSSSLAVKKFCRTMSTMDIQTSDIRPLPVLLDTLKHLFSLMESSKHPFEVVHDFVFDRTRSIRQDLGVQNIINDQVIGMYEEMVKFHIISHHKLMRCGDPNISSLHYLNMEQLVKTLLSLFDLYDINRRSNPINKNENEFYSFYVLVHLGSKSHLMVRMVALSYINQGNYKIHPYPLAHLSLLLMMKESEVESLCNACGLQTSTDEVGIKFLPTKQTSFCLPKGGFQSYSFLGFERLQRYSSSLSHVLKGTNAMQKIM